MTNKIITLFLLITIAASCSNNKSINYNEIFVDYKNNSPVESIRLEDRFNYSDYVDTVVYVSLETSDYCIVGKVRDLHFVNDKIFIEDQKNIFVFARDGKFISKVSKFGRGHGEYVSLSFFDVNPSNDEICIYDDGKRMVHVYSIHGDFLRDVRIDGLPRDFCVMSNGNYLFYTPDEMKDHYRGVWQTDPNGKFINQPVVLSGPSKKVLLTDRNLMHISKNEVGLIGPTGFNNIYHVSTDTSIIAYQINTNKKIAKKVLKDDEAGKIMDQDVYFIMDYYETDRLIGFCIDDFKGNTMDVRYDKESKKAYTQSNHGFDGGGFLTGNKVPFNMSVKRSDYGIALGVVDASLVMGRSFKDKIAPNCKEDSNPIVALYYYKQ